MLISFNRNSFEKISYLVHKKTINWSYNLSFHIKIFIFYILKKLLAECARKYLSLGFYFILTYITRYFKILFLLENIVGISAKQNLHVLDLCFVKGTSYRKERRWKAWPKIKNETSTKLFYKRCKCVCVCMFPCYLSFTPSLYTSFFHALRWTSFK